MCLKVNFKITLGFPKGFQETRAVFSYLLMLSAKG